MQATQRNLERHVEPHPAEAWQRVGRLLKQRRPQLSPRYRIRKIFAAERGITDKTAQEVENAYRTNFSPEMIAVVEWAYALQQGSFDRTLSGGELEPDPDREPPRGSAAAPTDPAPTPETGDEEQRYRRLLHDDAIRRGLDKTGRMVDGLVLALREDELWDAAYSVGRVQARLRAQLGRARKSPAQVAYEAVRHVRDLDDAVWLTRDLDADAITRDHLDGPASGPPAGPAGDAGNGTEG
jgi:hypothetical protein